jgi:hypothetical protein
MTPEPEGKRRQLHPSVVEILDEMVDAVERSFPGLGSRVWELLDEGDVYRAVGRASLSRPWLSRVQSELGYVFDKRVHETASPSLDPRTGHAYLDMYDIGGNGECSDRFFFWRWPDRAVPRILDDDLRNIYPEIDDEEWERLLREAAKRADVAAAMREVEERYASTDESEVQSR